MNLARAMLALGLTLAEVLVLQAASGATTDELNPEWGVIFPASKATSITFADNNRVSGAWSPGESDVRMIEPLLASAMRGAFDRAAYGGKSPLRVSSYYRQYGGVYMGGKRLIIVNAFHRSALASQISYVTEPCATLVGRTQASGAEIRCAKPADFWKREVVGAYDGGCHYLHAAFDVSKKTFEYVFCQQ